MNQKIKSYLPPSIFLVLLIVISFFHYKTQGLWELIDREKDQLAQEVRQSINQLLAQKDQCHKIIPMLEKKSSTAQIGNFIIPSTISYKGYLVDFLPVELIEQKADSVIVRYHFNVKERLQYSNWYLVTVELAVASQGNGIVGCHMIKQISGGEDDFSPEAQN